MRPADQMPNELADRLYAMREAAKLTGGALAEQLGWSQSKVSKIQSGKQQPTEDDIEDWAAACGHPEAAGELLDILAKVRVVHRTWKRRHARGSHADSQRELDRRTRQARCVRNLQIAVLSGLVQTPEYARHIITMFCKIQEASLDGVEEAVAARMQRQNVLYEPERKFEFVITENILHRRVGDPSVMLGQLAFLAQLSRMANITLAILPDDAEGLEVIPYQGFMMLDGSVILEGASAEDALPPEEGVVFARIMDAVLAECVTGDEARELISRAARGLDDAGNA